MWKITYKYCLNFGSYKILRALSQVHILQTNMEGSKEAEIRETDEERLYEIDTI